MAGTLRQADNLRVHPVADGYVVRLPSTGAVHHLNPTAALILELCGADRMSADDLVGVMKRMFKLSPAECRSVRTALDQLVRDGLVVISRPRS